MRTISRSGRFLVPRFLLIVLSLSLLAGCGELLRLRDDYMGKSLLQPDQVARPVARDERGDAVVVKE